MVNENTTFKEYLYESGYTEQEYLTEVIAGLDKIYGEYNLNYAPYIKIMKDAFKDNVPVDTIVEEITTAIDTDWSDDSEEIIEDELENQVLAAEENGTFKHWGDGLSDEEFEQAIEADDIDESTDPICAQCGEPKGDGEYNKHGDWICSDCIDEYNYLVGESTETKEKKEETDDGVSDGETYKDWKLNVFQYIDKRVDVNKVKELGTYIKDFIKQEYDNGEPSWFGVAESIVNYTRINYPSCVKTRIPYNLDEGFTFFKKYDKDPYINKCLSILKKKKINIEDYRDEIVKYLNYFKEDGSDIWAATDCAFQHFHKYRTV